MADPKAILAIDQGTTSTRCIVFDVGSRPLATERRELPQQYPRPGWVEQDAEAIWRDTMATARSALAGAGQAVRAIGIANQRETVVVWDRRTGAPVHPAIVWQDRRTAEACACLRADGAEPMVRERTGLLLDPYFSATKLGWILDHVEGARRQAEQGELLFGTIDSFLLWRLTGGQVHATDATNAARTLLFDIHRCCWDEDLLRLFRIPAAMLPELRDNATIFGETAPGLFDGVLPIAGMAGDQQAALVGQGCLAPGMVKATYGTGCFALMNTGEQALASRNRLLTTVGYRLGGRTTYALEGAIFTAGAAIKWLRDGLGLITHASQTDDLATRVPDHHGVYMVPGFVGLGAPHWDPEARGLICGLTLDATAAHIARAALEAVAYQTYDLAEAMSADGGRAPTVIRVDGGMAANDWFCQFLADMLATEVERPAFLETTALGAAVLAGLGSGLHSTVGAAAGTVDPPRRFEPRMEGVRRETLLGGWRDAVRRTLTPLQ
ncbi:glycerol kinase GlpK [Pseudoroseomonas globiformis]|uniref:Glycerol kinase n=1 Tax=Teichococcus globiformis TaxID=2307229 RepID=A0ABV7FXH8_9PROT